MTKGAIGKLGKLKCMLKKWHAKSQRHYHRRRLGHDNDGGRGEVVEEEEARRQQQPQEEVVVVDRNVEDTDKVPAGMHQVYVGKSRRRYLIASHLADHPLFQVLVQRSAAAAGGPVVECEVVLFEHLLWMLENADPQPEALDEFVDFYSCDS